MTKFFFPVVFFLFVFSHSSAQKVLHNGHAHNDYWHSRPLFQSLKNGFMSVEADCYLINGKMLVAHEKMFARKKRTLEKLYLEPLFKRAQENNFNSVYKSGEQEFVLYIDIKADCENFIPHLNSILKKYSRMLTVFENGKKISGAVRVLIDHCGNDEFILKSEPRCLSLSGNMSDIDKKNENDMMPRISFSYKSLLSWKGKGKMPETEKEKLKFFLEKAHNNGYTVRMWAAGNKKKVWKELADAGADWINVDRLRKFRKFMESR